MPVKVREYTDLDLDFQPHPISGDISQLRDADAVKRSIRNILLTNIYEKPFRPNIGSKIAHLLFEPVDPLTKYALRDEIFRAILINEPRARIVDIRINYNLDENRYDATIQFSIENFTEIVTVNIFLERIR